MASASQATLSATQSQRTSAASATSATSPAPYTIDPEQSPSPASRTITNVTVAQLILEYLKLEGADTLFGVPGAAIMHLLNELKVQRGTFRYIVTRQETGAAYMADGYSRLSGKLGVVAVTSGPGAINALTGTMNAQASGVPLLAITGEVPEQYFGKGYLQEGTDSSLNVDGVYSSATGYSAIVASPLSANTIVQQALRDALSIPHHGVHLSVPDDVGASSIASVTFPNAPHNYRATSQASDRRRAELALQRLLNVDRPLILVGSGARAAMDGPQRAKLGAIASKFAIPVMTTANAKASFPETHEMSLRNFGISFCEWTKYYMAPNNLDPTIAGGYDSLLVLGSQLDDFATSVFDPILVPRQSLVQVDLDSSVIGRVFPVDFGIVADVATVIDDMYDVALSTVPNASVVPRRAFIERIKRESSPYLEPEKRNSLQSPILPQAAMKCVSDLLPRDSVVFQDAGNCFGWALHYLTVDETTSVYASLAMGPMGWGTVAAIGAKLAVPDRTVVTIVGDGAFLMHGSELSTAAANGIGTIFIVLNDDDLGMVSQGMNHFFPDESGAWTNYYNIGKPDLARYAQSLGAEAFNVTTVEDMRRALPAAIRSAELNKKPQVIVVHIDGTEIPPFYQNPGTTPAPAPPSTPHVPINPPNWPKPIGPYSEGVKVGNQLFVSGQGPMDPATGKFVLGPIADQTRLTLTNVKTIVEAAGGTMADVTMVNVHLADLSNFAAMNAVYQEFFPTDAPARATVGATLLAGIGIEIDCVAVLGS